MKIAIPTEGSNVAAHFGHCEGFTIYEIENNKVTNNQFVQNPGHRPGFLPNFLHEQGVEIVIAGGMGTGAIEIFQENKIKVITGAFGDINEVINSYLSGNLVTRKNTCEH